MAKRRRYLIQAAVLTLLAVLAVPAVVLSDPPGRHEGGGDDDDDARDHVRAFKALKDGKIVPIATILDYMDKHFRGSIVEIELESDETPMLYEVEYLTEQGNFLEFHFDAATGKMLNVKGAGAEAARKQQ